MSVTTWRLAYSTTLTEAATSVTISSLAGNTDVVYKLIVRHIQGQAGYVASIGFNGDTASNYGYQNLRAANTVASAARGADTSIAVGYGTTLANVSLSEALIYAKSGYIRTIIGLNTWQIAATTVGYAQLNGNSWNNTADEITSINIYSATSTSGLGIGTVIELWKLASVSNDWTKSFTDTMTISEPSILKAMARPLLDTATISEPSMIKAMARPLNDTTTISDTYSRQWTIARIFSEAVTLTEVAAKNISIFIDDVATLIDNHVRTITHTFTDTTTISDIFTKTLLWLKESHIATAWNKATRTVTTWTKAVKDSITWRKKYG